MISDLKIFEDSVLATRCDQKLVIWPLKDNDNSKGMHVQLDSKNNDI